MQQVGFTGTETARSYQDNIKRSEELQAEILKGIKQGENVCVMLIKAACCISCMTGDKAFYEQVRRDVKEIYGTGLLDWRALDVELRETRQRIVLLETAKTRDVDEHQNIRAAIRAHRERERELTARISQLR